MKKFFQDTVRNYFRYVMPTLIVLCLGGILWAATTIQSFTNSSGSNVANVDSNGSLNMTGSGAFNFSPVGVSTISNSGVVTGGTFNGGNLTGGTLTAGRIDIFMPHQGSEYKSLIIEGSGVTATGNTLGITLPTPFAGTSGTAMNVASGSLMNFVITGGSYGTLTLASTGSVGTLIIQGR